LEKATKGRRCKLDRSARASITLSSFVPAWETQIQRPSAVQATPHGLAAPSEESSRSTVLSTSRRPTSIAVNALAFIHPLSTRTAGR